ncbi:MAG: formyltetrahydrofolate deformylase [Pseudomonadota bacterium]
MDQLDGHCWILTLSCGDRSGIVSQVTGHLHQIGGNIMEAQQYRDPETNRFFMRVEFEVSNTAGKGQFESFGSLAAEFDMRWQFRLRNQAKKALILVSKFDHCLSDLLYRRRIGELKMDIVGIVSNHPGDNLHLPVRDAIPFHHFPVSKDSKPQQEAQIRDVIEKTGAELIILARYMQILSDDMAQYLRGRCINIHHSFLPGFKGAKPYHQAYQRGVKMIGATAHFVTSDLDEGPIIEQDVEQVSHNDTPEDLVTKGRNIEQRVLSRAVGYVLEDRILLNGRKTVVFRR